MGYTIKTVAQKTHLNPYVLRYYEKEGLLPHVNRTDSGIRCYTDDDLEWLGLICCLKNTGMSIRQMRDFVNLTQQGPETLKERCELLRAHYQEVEERIAEMNRHLEMVSCKIERFTREYDTYQAQLAGKNKTDTV